LNFANCMSTMGKLPAGPSKIVHQIEISHTVRFGPLFLKNKNLGRIFGHLIKTCRQWTSSKNVLP
jgi:hypothetical protein